MNKCIKVITIVAVMTCLFGTVAMAASSSVSVIIYPNDPYAQTPYLYCSGYIDGFGVNDSSSTQSLYYTLRIKKSVGSSEVYSTLMVPGTGSMGATSVSTWATLFTGKSVSDGPGNYFIRLNPKGALGRGCYGAAMLVTNVGGL